MIKRLAAVAASLLIAAAAAAQVPLAELEALYGAAYPGTGIRSTAIVPQNPCAADQVLTVNSAGTGFICTTPSTVTPTTTFTALTDTPASITADLCVVGNSAGTALGFGACGTGGAADGVVDSGSFLTSPNRIILTRTQGLPNLVISGLPTDTTNTISSAAGQDIAATGAAGSTGQVSDSGHVHGGYQAPAAWARETGATGTAPAARLPGHTVHRESGSMAYDSANGQIRITIDGTEQVGDLIIFDAPSNMGTDSSVLLSLSVDGGANRNLVDREENRINETHLVANAWYIVQRDSSDYQVLTDLSDALSQADVNTLITSGALQPANIVAGTNVTVTTGTDTVTISAQTGGTANTISTSAPQPVGTTAAAGSSGEVSDAAHVHVGPQGDITSVTTASDSGLTGGANSGAVALSLDIENLDQFTPPTYSDADDVFAMYNDDDGDEIGVTLGQLKTEIRDGVVTGGSFGGTTLTLNRSSGLAAVTISGIGGGGTSMADGVVASGSISGTTLTLQRTESLADVTITGLPDGLSEAEVDARVRVIVVYHDGNGPPATPPPAGGVLAIDNAGHLYGAINQTITHTSDPAITSTSVLTGGIGGYYRGYDTAQLSGTVGYFQYLSFNHQFRQLRAGTPNFITNTSWNAATNYIQSVASGTDYRQSVYLGSFADNDAAAAAMSTNSAALANYSSGTPADTNKAYFINTTLGVLRSVESFSAGTTTTTVNRAWSNEALTIGALRAHLKPFVEAGTRGVRVGDMDSESATADYVPKADGSGGVAWAEEATLPLSDATPQPVGTAAAGTGMEASRTDHVHVGVQSLSNDTPQAVGTAAPGTGDEASRSDHVHEGSMLGLSDDNPELVGTVAAPGTDTEASRSDHAHAAALGFLNLTDTPAGYPAGGLDLVRVNQTADGIEFVDEPEPAHEIPIVGSLPEYSADSPNIVYLVADYGTGTRNDATLTRGIDSGLAGYSDGEALDNSFGSISEPSPLAALWGQATQTNYSLQLVVSSSEEWLNEFTHIIIGGSQYGLLPTFLNAGYFHRRIDQYPTNLTLTDITINFRRADGSYYWTDNADGSFLSGLWEKFDGMYSRLTSKGLVHVDGIGEPTTQPTAAAQSYIDDLGRLWISGDMIIHPMSPPQITSANDLTNDFYLDGSTPFVLQEAGTPDGRFTHWSGYFWQRQGANVVTASWGAIWQYIYGTVPGWEDVGNLTTSLNTTATEVFLTAAATETIAPDDVLRIAASSSEYEYVRVTAVTNQAQFTVQRGYLGQPALDHAIGAAVDKATGNFNGASAANRRLNTSSVYVGEFATEALAAEERSLYTDGSLDYYFISGEEPDRPRLIVGYSGATTVAVDHFFWRGPYIDRNDALSIVEAVVIPNPTFADPTRDLTTLYVGGVVYDVESVIHPNRVTGDLRLATADDWDAACQCSRNIAWDGHQFFEAQRYLDGAHSADAVFTEVPEGTRFDYDGVVGRYRWRGSIDSAGPNINQINGDFYFWGNRSQMQEWIADENRWGLRDGPGFGLWEALEYKGYFINQTIALGHITASGQRVVINDLPERSRGTVRVTGTEGTNIPLGHEFRTTGGVQFFIIEHGTIPAGGSVVLKARAHSGGSNGNVAASTAFTFFPAITGVTALEAESAFTRGDDVRGGKKLFTVNSFEPPDNVDEYRYRWVPIELGPDEIEQLVWPNQFTGVLRPATSADYNAQTGQSSVVAFDGRLLYRAKRNLITTGGTHAATFTVVPDGTMLTIRYNTLTGTFRFRDVHYQDYLVENVQDDDIYLNRHSEIGHWRRYDTQYPVGARWLDVTPDSINGQSWRGYFASEHDALAHVSGNGQYVAYGSSLYVTSDFVDGSTSEYTYEWAGIIPEGNALDPADQSILDILHEREPDDATLTTADRGQGGTLIGWSHIPGQDEHGSLTDDDNLDDDVYEIAYFTSAYPFELEGMNVGNRLYILVGESCGNEKYDGAKVRWTNPNDDEADEYTLETLDCLTTFSPNRQRYISSGTVSYRPAIGSTVHFNLENPDREDIELFGGVPWQWHAERASGGGGTPGDGTIGTQQLADQAVTTAKIANQAVSLIKVNPVGSTDGQVMTSTGPTTAPAWETITAGTGDITGISTANTSGLTGGVATGTANLAIDFDRLTSTGQAWAVEQNDDLFAIYSDDESAHIKLTPLEVANGLSGLGTLGDITAVTTNATDSGLSGGATSGIVDLEVDLRRLEEFDTTNDAIEGPDRIAVINESGTNDPTEEITLTEFFGDILGDNLTWNATDNQIDATGGGTTGITQAQADARYGQLAAANTFSANNTFTGTGTATSPLLVDTDAGVAAFMVDQRAKNHGSPGFLIRTGPSGGGHRRVMEAFSGDETDAWFSVEWRSGGGFPRLGFGDGQGGGRDVTLERAAANVWATDAGDTFRAGVLDVSGTLATTQTNLGIVTAFTGLSDTPAAITADECVMGNTAGTALEFGDCGAGGGTTVAANPAIVGTDADLTGITIAGTDYDVLDPDDLTETLDFRTGTSYAELDVNWSLNANNDGPTGMAWTGTHILVVDNGDDTVYRYEQDGTFVDTWALTTNNSQPRGITWNGTHVMVVDIGTPANRGVYRYMADGTYVDMWTLQGAHTSPHGITWNGSEVNITHTANGQIYQYEADGTFIETWGLNGSNGNPIGITWTGSQYLVTDHDDAEVYRYGANQIYQGRWSHGVGNGDSVGMTFVEGAPHIVDEDDRVYKYTFGSVTSFQALTDTPDTFGTAGQQVVVNSGGNGLAFADASASAATVTTLTSEFDGVLSDTDTNVQAALNTIDDITTGDEVQTFARETPVDMWDTSAWIRQAAFGNQLLGRHVTVAPVGEDEVVLYRSAAKLVPAFDNGQVLDSDPLQQADLRDYATSTDRRFPHLNGEAQQPADPPTYMLDADSGVVTADFRRLRLVFTGTDVPYISLNTRFFDEDGTQVRRNADDTANVEFVNWEELVMYIRLERADGVGTVYEGMFPFNADMTVGADVRGDPYSAREIHFREYLGMTTGGLDDDRPGDLNNAYDTRRAAYPNGPYRTMMEAMIEWLWAEDGFHLERMRFTSPDYSAGFLEQGQPTPTQAEIDPYVVDATLIIINGADPRFDAITMSAFHSSARTFRESYEARLLPEDPDDGQIAQYDGTTGGWVAVPAPTGGGTGGGLLKQRYLVSSTTATTIDSATWTTILTQDVTVVVADRVYADAVISIESTANNSQCELRVTRGTTLVGSVVQADIGFNGEIENKAIRVMETPGAGTHTYNVQVQDNGSGDCLVNAVGTTSFVTVDVLGANP